MNSSEPSPSPVRLEGPVLDWPRQTGKVDTMLKNIEAKLKAKRRRRRRTVGATASALIFGAIACWLVPYLQKTDRIATAPGQRQTLALADGSAAHLNARTDLRTDFRYGRRRVRLERGEAFFAVSRDANHPFWVETPLGTVRVTGTQFNVRLAGERAEVTILEGSVRLEDLASASLPLVAGEQAILANVVPERRALTSEELAQVVAWREGALVLDGLTLADVADRFAAYHGKEIAVASEIALRRMGGVSKLDDLAGFFEFLRSALLVDVVRLADGSYRVTERPRQR